MMGTCTCQKVGYKISIFIGITMFLMELIGGQISNSYALFEDSWHLFADILTLGMGLYVLQTKTDKARADRIGGMTNGSLLAMIGIWMMLVSWQRILHPPITNGNEVVFISTVGLIGNLLMLFVLQFTRRGGTKSLTRSGIVAHVFSDTLQSIAVLVSGWLIQKNIAHSEYVDPFFSTGIAFILTFYGVQLVIKSVSGEHDHVH